MAKPATSYWRGLWHKSIDWLMPRERLKTTPEGMFYWVSCLVLAVVGWYQQINLILLICGMVAGPIVTSFFMSTAMLRKVRIKRRLPSHVFAGDELAIDYVLDNSARKSAVLALTLTDEWVPLDPVPGSTKLSPRVFFSRVAGGTRDRTRWQVVAPSRGRYRAQAITLLTRFPFGLMERSSHIPLSETIVIYPRIGHLTRRWQIIHRESSQTRRGQQHDRSAQQQEYHGLRDYRPDDSPRWIHWRTSARINQLMIKEFEQQSEQDLVILLDPWLPKHRATDAMKANVELAVEFAASLCVDLCRRERRRLTLGWTGAVPDLRQGPASVRLLHEMLTCLATIKPNHDLSIHQLMEIMPPATLREAIFIIVSTRPMQWSEELARSERLRSASGRGLTNRIVFLDASSGALDPLIEFDRRGSKSKLEQAPAAVQDDSSAQQDSNQAPNEPAMPMPVAGGSDR